MIWLVVGLLIFIGIHSIRIVSDETRTQFIAKHGGGAWKGLYSIASLVGFVLMVYGYNQTRLDPTFLWHPPAAMRHVASLLLLFAFIILAGAYIPKNGIKARLGHPMIIATKIWAFAHLLANGRLGDVVLFGAFLLWAVPDLISAKRRDRAGRINHSASETTVQATVVTVVVGLVAYMVFALWIHAYLIGVSPFG